LITPWEKNPYRLSEAPDGLSGPDREKFGRALALSGQGLWSDAANLFLELIATNPGLTVAERNLGLCRLWLADHQGAVEALRRYLVKTPPCIDSVDLEALCQIIADSGAGQQIEFIQLSWPLRNREGLIDALKQDSKVDYTGSRKVEPEDESSPIIEQFVLIDRPRIEARPGLTPAEIPIVQGSVLVGPDTVQLEAHDAGQLDELTDRFTTLAGRNIPPAHPRTKVLEKIDKTELDLSWNWSVPKDLSDEESDRLNREQGARIIREVWPDTPMPYLHRRTPRQVAGHPNAEVPLRAAVLHYQVSSREASSLVDWDQLRAELKIPREPEIDPATIDVEAIHLSRLEFVPCDRLDDSRLEALYLRAGRFGLAEPQYRAALAIAERPGFCSRSRIPEAKLFGELALHAAREEKREEAVEWLRRGRAEEPAATRALLTPAWEMHELQIRMMFDQPEDWVPDLAVILERYTDNQIASQIINSRLVNLGLLRMVTDPNRPGETLVDPSPLEFLLRRFGPRVKTASGYLGVSATKGEIWTPESASGGSSGLWTPGSEVPGASSGADRPRLILPGQ
jgi:tetratricopeptide (TPR) repeat protein